MRVYTKKSLEFILTWLACLLNFSCRVDEEDDLSNLEGRANNPSAAPKLLATVDCDNVSRTLRCLDFKDAPSEPVNPTTDTVHEYIDNVMLLQTMSELSYYDRDVVAEKAKTWGVKRHIFIERYETTAIMFGWEDRIVVAFRGTEANLRDYLTDATFLPVNYNGAHIHSGFVTAYSLIAADIKRTIASWSGGKPVQLWLTGHSLGGALATVAAFDLSDQVSALVTFGSPRVGLKSFADRMKHVNLYLRFVYVKDIITEQPSASFGYVHASPAVWFNDNCAMSIVNDARSKSILDKLNPINGFLNHNANNYRSCVGLNK